MADWKQEWNWVPLCKDVKLINLNYCTNRWHKCKAMKLIYLNRDWKRWPTSQQMILIQLHQSPKICDRSPRKFRSEPLPHGHCWQICTPIKLETKMQSFKKLSLKRKIDTFYCPNMISSNGELILANRRPVCKLALQRNSFTSSLVVRKCSLSRPLEIQRLASNKWKDVPSYLPNPNDQSLPVIYRFNWAKFGWRSFQKQVESERWWNIFEKCTSYEKKTTIL